MQALTTRDVHPPRDRAGRRRADARPCGSSARSARCPSWVATAACSTCRGSSAGRSAPWPPPGPVVVARADTPASVLARLRRRRRRPAHGVLVGPRGLRRHPRGARRQPRPAGRRRRRARRAHPPRGLAGGPDGTSAGRGRRSPCRRPAAPRRPSCLRRRGGRAGRHRAGRRRRGRGRHDHGPAPADAPRRRLGRRAGRRPGGPALGADPGRVRGGAGDGSLLRGRLHPVRSLAPAPPPCGRPTDDPLPLAPRHEPARPGLAHRAQPRLAAAHGHRDRVGGRRPELPAQRRQLVRDRPARGAAADQHRAHLRLPARRPGERRPRDHHRPRRDRARSPGRRTTPVTRSSGTSWTQTSLPGTRRSRPWRAWCPCPDACPHVALVGRCPVVAGRGRGAEGRRHDVRLDAREPDPPARVPDDVHRRRHLHAARRGRRVLVRAAAPDRAGAPAPAARPVAARAVDHDPGRDRADERRLVRDRRPGPRRHPRADARRRRRSGRPRACATEGLRARHAVDRADPRGRQLPARDHPPAAGPPRGRPVDRRTRGAVADPGRAGAPLAAPGGGDGAAPR